MAMSFIVVFSNPDFTPQIGKFQLKDGKLVQIGTILLKNAAGKKTFIFREESAWNE